jgi:hypothetical protein
VSGLFNWGRVEAVSTFKLYQIFLNGMKGCQQLQVIGETIKDRLLQQN